MNEQNRLPEKSAAEVDFPIERTEAEHVSRREFAKYLCVVSGGLAVGNGWIAVKDRIFPPFRVKGEVFICRAPDVPVGGTYPFRLEGTMMPYILIRPTEQEWFAYEQKCTHLSCAVFYSPDHGKIQCPCHNGWFDARTGEVLQGPPPRPLPSLTVVLKGEDIYVTQPPEHKTETTGGLHG